MIDNETAETGTRQIEAAAWPDKERRFQSEVRVNPQAKKKLKIIGTEG